MADIRMASCVGFFYHKKWYSISITKEQLMNLRQEKLNNVEWLQTGPNTIMTPVPEHFGWEKLPA